MQFKSTVVAFALTFAVASAAPQIGSLASSFTGLLGGQTQNTGATPDGQPLAGQNTGVQTIPENNKNGTLNVADCPENTQAYCCDGAYNADGGLLNLNCAVQSVMGAGSTCDKESVCCTNNGGTQFCSSQNGAEINVPLTLGGLSAL
ncbi:hypothetical protein DH86_00001874 [Scytalidium sp. 3C]|nr:hypothetical protein DH86_00001874 [Scytalidium sp. 3C]